MRWKRVRPALTQELRTHLEEQAEAYRAEGLPAAEAEAEAVRQMGDAEQIGLALDAVHRPKRQTAILSLAGICILLGAIFRILSQDSPKLFTLAALVLTAGLLLGGYSFDYRRLARYAWQIYGVVLALGAVCLYRSFHLANGIGIELGISMGIENEYVVLLFPLAYALAVYALRGKRGGFVLALYAGVPFIAFLHLSDMAPIYQVSFFSRLMLRVELTAVLLIAIRAGFFRVKAGWACAAVLALLALGVYLDVRSGASQLTSYFSPEAMQLWRSLAQKQPFADQLMNRTLRQLQQAGVTVAFWRKKTAVGMYDVCFMEEDLLKVCTVCGKDYAAERQKRIAQDARADYARLKADAGRKGDRIIYRVVDEMLYLQLRQSKLPMAAFPKDAAYNVAFMESKLKRYEQILREASMQQEQQRRSELHNGGREN